MTSCAWLWNEAVSASLPDPNPPPPNPTPNQPKQERVTQRFLSGKVPIWTTFPNENGLIDRSCRG